MMTLSVIPPTYPPQTSPPNLSQIPRILGLIRPTDPTATLFRRMRVPDSLRTPETPRHLPCITVSPPATNNNNRQSCPKHLSHPVTHPSPKQGSTTSPSHHHHLNTMWGSCLYAAPPHGPIRISPILTHLYGSNSTSRIPTRTHHISTTIGSANPSRLPNDKHLQNGHLPY